MTPFRIFFFLASSLVLFEACPGARAASFQASAGPVEDYPAGLPFPAVANTPVGIDFGLVFAAWSKGVMVDTYQRLHPGDASVLAFVRDGALYLQGGNESVRAELSHRADQLNLAATSDDPVVHFLTGVVDAHAIKREDLYRRSLAGLAQSNYSRFLVFMVAANLGKSLQDRNADPADIALADRRALEALRQGLNAESFHGDESSALRWRLDAPSADSLFKRQALALIEIFEQAQAVPEWVREFGEGRGYLAAAWQARTDGWSSEVSEAGWEGWKRNLAKARQHFTKAWELNPRDPAAATYMIEVTMGDGGGKKELRAWFDRAVASQMDFFDAYRSLIWALRPRWSGSHEEMLLFGDECLGTGRFDTCVPFYYFKVVADIASEESDVKEIYERPEIAGNLKLALESYLSTRDSPLAVSYAHTVAAILDFKSGNLEAAKSHMAAIQFKPDPNVDAGLKGDLSKLVRSISAPASGMTHGATNSAPAKF
jgi:hypothetical protein